MNARKERSRDASHALKENARLRKSFFGGLGGVGCLISLFLLYDHRSILRITMKRRKCENIFLEILVFNIYASTILHQKSVPLNNLSVVSISLFPTSLNEICCDVVANVIYSTPFLVRCRAKDHD